MPKNATQFLPSTFPEARITIVDFVTGRITGGHQYDYLNKLETVLTEMRPSIIAPFRDSVGKGRSAIGFDSKSRVARYLAYFWRFRAVLRQGYPQVLIFPSPEFRDFIVFFLAVVLKSRRAWVVGLFVLRRGAAGVVGHAGWKARVLTSSVRWLAHHSYLYPISDSRNALTEWEGITGVEGCLVGMPMRQVKVTKRSKRPTDHVTVGLIGLFRMEKGAAVYDIIIREALALAGPVTVVMQLPSGMGGQEGEIARYLRTTWKEVPEVRILNGHIDTDAYTTALESLDIIVLPYNVSSYGAGTSGVMFEAVALGAVAVATRFEWAVEKFQNNADVFWLNGVDPQSIGQALKAAISRVYKRRQKKTPPSTRILDNFSPSWFYAIDRAKLMLQK